MHDIGFATVYGKDTFNFNTRGVEERYVDIHTHSAGSGGDIRLLSYSVGMDKLPPAVGFFSAGVHPWSAAAADMPPALEYLRSAPAAAIGEIGLDYSVRDLDKQVQLSVFKAQLAVAEERGLPVVIHCVKAYNDVLNILGDYGLKAVIFHGYTGSVQQTETITSKGYYVSAGEVSLNSSRTAEALKSCPAGSLFAETDTSDTDIRGIYRRLADIRGEDVHILRKEIYENYKKVFG